MELKLEENSVHKPLLLSFDYSFLNLKQSVKINDTNCSNTVNSSSSDLKAQILWLVVVGFAIWYTMHY